MVPDCILQEVAFGVEDLNGHFLMFGCLIEKCWCFWKHELEKKRAYEQRILEIEHVSFTPLDLSASGGLAKESTNFYKNLASKLAEKLHQPYSQTMTWLECILLFALLRSAIQCVRCACSYQAGACC